MKAHEIIKKALSNINALDHSGPAFEEAERQIIESAVKELFALSVTGLETWATTRAAVTKYDLLKYIKEVQDGLHTEP